MIIAPAPRTLPMASPCDGFASVDHAALHAHSYGFAITVDFLSRRGAPECRCRERNPRRFNRCLRGDEPTERRHRALEEPTHRHVVAAVVDFGSRP